MTRNFVIGIGGTGARCVESFLHLCASGLGPDNVSVGLIDQDESNGNVIRTKELAKSLGDLRASLRQDGGHKLGSKALFLDTEVSLIGDTGFWCPLPGNNPAIREAFDYQTMGDAIKELFESLFSDDERQMGLAQGYRARPSLGAAVLAGRALRDDPFWKALADGLKQGAGSGAGSRLFVFGSLFGGTGAAGFPTLARIVREHPLMQGIRGIRVGGALMLPYFQFGEPPATNGGAPLNNASPQPQVLRARSSEFVKQAESALRYYDRLFDHNLQSEKSPIYDEVYLIGWNPFIRLPYLGDGGQTQANPPMVPELYAALAAARFLQADPGTTSTGTQFYKIGTGRAGEVVWSDLPPVSQGAGVAADAARDKVRSALGQQIRFCFAFRRVYRPALAKENWRRYRREEWLRRQVTAAAVDLNDATIGSILDKIDAYAEAHLRWAATLAAVGAGAESRPLYDFQYYARFESQSDGGLFSIKLHDEELKPAERATLTNTDCDGFSRLTTSGVEGTLAEVMHRLTYKAPDAEHQKLGRFVGELHAACAFHAQPTVN